MNERDDLLARVREALSVGATPGHSNNGIPAGQPVGALRAHSRQWMPRCGDSFEERLALFQKNVVDLKAQFHVCVSMNELQSKLRAMRDAAGWKRIGIHSGSLAEQAETALSSQFTSFCRTNQAYAVKDLESCDAGISECDALIAQTGSVLVTSRSAGGRALSVLPPHHIVLARREQLVGGLPDAFRVLKERYGTDLPSFVSFITGPSRTGDIERILVLGAHGPKQLTIFMVG